LRAKGLLEFYDLSLTEAEGLHVTKNRKVLLCTLSRVDGLTPLKPLRPGRDAIVSEPPGRLNLCEFREKLIPTFQGTSGCAATGRNEDKLYFSESTARRVAFAPEDKLYG